MASETLNSFGVDYLATGRGITAVQSIAKRDSDRDGFSNEAELLKGTDPGDATSTPSTPIATNRTFTAAELKALSPVVRKAVFLNTSRNKQGDFYNEYRGNAVYELLQAMGISENAESVDFISMDGFEGSFILGELKSEWPQAAPAMKLGKDTAGPCGWVNYNVAGLDEKKPLPAMKIMLAFEENGKKIDAGNSILKPDASMAQAHCALSYRSLRTPLPTCRSLWKSPAGKNSQRSINSAKIMTTTAEGVPSP